MVNTPKYSVCYDYLNRPDIFKPLTQEEFDLLIKNLIIIRFNPGEIIIKQNTRATQAFIVIDGFARYFIENEDGTRLIVKYYKNGDFVGISGLYTDKIYTYSVSAVDECWTCFIDYEVLQKLINKNTNFSENIIQHLSNEKSFIHTKLACLTMKQVPGRVANAILYLNDVFNDKKIKANRTDIAELTGMSKDTAGRVLRDFVNSKIIFYNGTEIKILDRKKLEEIKKHG